LTKMERRSEFPESQEKKSKKGGDGFDSKIKRKV